MKKPDPHLHTREDRLRYWLQEVCRLPRHNSQSRPNLAWSQAINFLIAELQSIPGLAQSSHQDYPEILNNAWLWVSDNIHKFEPAADKTLEVSFKDWINGQLHWRIKDLWIADQKRSKTEISLERPVSSKTSGVLGDFLTDKVDFIHKINYTNLDTFVQAQQQQVNQNAGLAIELYIEADPEGKLRALYPKDQPACHCQMLSQRILLKEPKDKPRAIAQEFNLPEQTLYSHCKRCWKFLQTLAQELGYQPEVNQ